MVFHHFGSKRELMLQLASQWGHGLSEIVAEHDSVEAIVRAMFAYAREHRLLREALAAGADPQEWDSAHRSSRDQVVEAITASLQADRGRGLGRAIDPGITAGLVFGVVETALRDCYVRNQGRDQEEYVSETAAFLRGALGLPSRA